MEGPIEKASIEAGIEGNGCKGIAMGGEHAYLATVLISCLAV